MSPLRTAVAARINNGVPMECDFRVETDSIDVTTLYGHSEPDPAWVFVDDAGHFHAFDQDGKLPTLVERVAEWDREPGWFSEDDYDEDLRRWMACVLCGEEIKPQYRYVPPPSGRQFMPGRTSYYLTVHGEVPRGERFSVVITASNAVWFGFGQSTGNETYEFGRPPCTEIGVEGMWRRKVSGGVA